MNRIKSFLSKRFGINFLTRFLYAGFWILLILFTYLLYLRITTFDFNYYSIFAQGDIIDDLFDNLSKPFAVGAAALAFLTLGLTASRTSRMDKQIEVSREQIKLMEKQMEASYQPDFLINNTDIYCLISDSKHGNSSISFHADKESNIPARLIFANVGKGVAKELTIRFSFDYKKAISNLQTLEISTSFNINEIIDQISVTSKDFKIDEYECSIKSDVFGHKRNYIYSVGQGESIISLPIPEIILLIKTLYEMIYKYLCENYSSNAHIYEDWKNLFPETFIEISYSDIGNKLYTKTYIINFILHNFPALSKHRDSLNTYKIGINPEEGKQNNAR